MTWYLMEVQEFKGIRKAYKWLVDIRINDVQDYFIGCSNVIKYWKMRIILSTIKELKTN